MGYTVYMDLCNNDENFAELGINTIFPLEVGVTLAEAKLTALLAEVTWGFPATIINRDYVTNHADFERENPDLVAEMDGSGCWTGFVIPKAFIEEV